MHACVKRDGGT